MKSLIVRLWAEERGQDLTEYALLLTLIALATVGAVRGLSATISNVFASSVNAMNTTT
jgi:Flp pilus assembly pilin Flp